MRTPWASRPLAVKAAVRRAGRAGGALLFTALAVLVFVVSNFSSGEKRYRTLAEESNRARAIIDAANNALSALKDTETGQRGFLITLKPAYLEPYESGKRAWTVNLDDLKARSGNAPRLQEPVRQFSEAGEAKLAHLAETIRNARRGKVGEAFVSVESGLGKQRMDEARRLEAEIISREETEYARLAALAMKTESQTRWSVEAAAAGLFLLTLAGTILLHRQIAKERSLAHDVEGSERKYRELAESLEQQVYQRTRELERVNEELQAFTWSVSHDLRAPLRAIDGLSLALLEDHAVSLDNAGRDLVDRIRLSVTRMAQLVRSLLELSRVTSVDLRKQPVSISDLSHAVVDGLLQGDSGRSVELIVQPGLVTEGDPNLLRSLMENLLSNAWKFTSRTVGARIEVGADSGPAGQEFFVRDNGSGFDTAYADKLFKPFQRLHSQAEFEGTGVGLAIALRIVRRHGGTIRAESDNGGGATFYFTLQSELKSI